MKHTRQEKLEYLFSEIGLIEDNLVQEALFWRAARKRSPRILLIAACLALSFTVLLSGFVIALVREPSDEKMNGGVNSEGNADGIFDGDSADQTGKDTLKLDGLLLDSRHKASYSALTGDEREYFSDGNVYLVWQYSEDGELCISRPLTEAESSRLVKQIGKGEEVGESSPELSCKVWILMGDGSVISPYLKQSIGNVGVTFFDYDAEIIPNEAFVSCVSEILET